MTDANETEGTWDEAEPEVREAYEAAPPAMGQGELVTDTSSEERTLAALAHAAGIVSTTMLPLLIPLVVYLIKKDESPFVAEQAKEALNFQITVILAIIVCVPLMLIVIGVFLAGIVTLASLILSIIGAIKTYEGKAYRYPVAIRVF